MMKTIWTAGNGNELRVTTMYAMGELVTILNWWHRDESGVWSQVDVPGGIGFRNLQDIKVMVAALQEILDRHKEGGAR